MWAILGAPKEIIANLPEKWAVSQEVILPEGAGVLADPRFPEQRWAVRGEGIVVEWIGLRASYQSQFPSLSHRLLYRTPNFERMYW